MGVSYMKVFLDFEERTEGLNDTEKGRLLLAMLRYAKSGEQPTLTGNERFVWPMLRAEFDRVMKVYRTKVENGSLGGRPSGQPSEENRTETENNRNEPDENRTETENNLNTQEKEKEKEQEKEQEKEGREARAREETRLISSFGMFWLQYPRKEGKKNAMREWMRLRPGPETVQEILSGLERQRKSEQWIRDGGQFIPHPATWLHDERWKDETMIRAGSSPGQNYSQRDYSGEQEEAFRRMIAGIAQDG